MLETPQEIEVWYVLPAIRKGLALAMANKGLKQVEVAEILGITKSAVNHYLKQKRAKDVILPDDVQEEIKKSTEVILKDNRLVIIELQRLCEVIRKNKCLCKIHHKFTKDEIPEKCKMCIEGV